jgi:aspartyl-tRNA(Asn)/glutamyl-tRNA(Gln) amidotransferase subunit C
VKLSREEIEHIADLAKLALAEDELLRYQEQLSAMLEYFERIQKLDTDAIPPTATVLPLRNVMRADDPATLFERDDLLAGAPESEEGCFKVPAVLE